MILKNNYLKSLLIIVLLASLYFIFNPFKVDTYRCYETNNHKPQNLKIVYYVSGRVDALFKNSFFTDDNCKKTDEIRCIQDIKQGDPEKIIFNLVSKELEYEWIEYESGKYVFDKTKVVTSNRKNIYSCELSD